MDTSSANAHQFRKPLCNACRQAMIIPFESIKSVCNPKKNQKMNHLMNDSFKSSRLLCAVLLGAACLHAQGQVLPITCGAVSTNTSAPLQFANGDLYAASSGFVQPLVYQRIANRYGTNNHYITTNLLFTAISAVTNSETSAAIGSYLVCRVASVSGPPGGVLYFWEQGNGRPTYQFPVGETVPEGKDRFIVSNCESGAGRPDGDPFGRIRGRRFSVNKAGEYTVAFQLLDASENHPTLVGTPIHAPSELLVMKFATAVDLGITSLDLTSGAASLVYKQGLLTNMFVEVSTNLMSWQPVAGPFTNAPPLTTNLFAVDPAVPSVYFRLRGDLP